MSGTTQYYKEFEMSARNATYDVLWGVPDGAGLSCSDTPDGIVPVCVNTSFPGYAGSWTMGNVLMPGRAGLTTYYLPLTTYYLLLTHYSLLLTTYHLLITHYSLLTTHYSLLISTYY